MSNNYQYLYCTQIDIVSAGGGKSHLKLEPKLGSSHAGIVIGMSSSRLLVDLQTGAPKSFITKATDIIHV